MSADLPRDRLERLLTAVESIERSLGILAEKQRLDREEYRRDSDAQDIVERRFVKATEAVLDVAAILLGMHETAVPKSNPETVYALVDVGVLTATTAEELAQAARFRNVLAHTYGPIVDDVVYDALQDLERYRTFVAAVRDHLDEVGAFDD